MGRTSPGQSQSVREGVTFSVWKCLVLPGVAATAVFLEPNRALMVEDLPTLGNPVSPTTSRALGLASLWSEPEPSYVMVQISHVLGVASHLSWTMCESLWHAS